MSEQRLEREKRGIIRRKTYRIRHDNGETFEVSSLTMSRIRKLIEAECQDRGWLLEDIDWFEVGEE